MSELYYRFAADYSSLFFNRGSPVHFAGENHSENLRHKAILADTLESRAATLRDSRSVKLRSFNVISRKFEKIVESAGSNASGVINIEWSYGRAAIFHRII